MKNIQAQYQDLLEGKMSKSNFMRNVRMQFPQHISPVTSYDDSVKILKGKRILSEVTTMNYLTDPWFSDFTQALMSMGYSKDEFNQLAADAQDAIETGELDTRQDPKMAAKKWAEESGMMDMGDKVDFARMQARGLEELNEAKKPEGVYGHNPNAENDLYRGVDHVNYYQMYRGLQYELAKMPEITDENYIKARKKVVDRILKDPDAYKDLQLANFKAVKEMDEDLEMKEVKKNNLTDKPNEMKVVKKDVKGNTQDTLGKKEKKKAKNGKGLDHMTQTPKGKLEAFATPGKEKVMALKEHILDEMTNINDKYEEIRKGSRVKKKADESKFGTVEEWDGHIAEVTWDEGDKESVTRNVLTTQDVPPTPTTKAKFGDKGPQGNLGDMWSSFTKSQREPEDKPVNEAAPIHTVTTVDGKTVVGTHQYGVGFKANEKGKEMGFKDDPTSIPNGTKMDNRSGIEDKADRLKELKEKLVKALKRETMWQDPRNPKKKFVTSTSREDQIIKSTVPGAQQVPGSQGITSA